MKKLLAETADRAARYLAGIANRNVAPSPEDVARLEATRRAAPHGPSDPMEVLALLDDVGSPATVATAGGRYFGFVIGGSLPGGPRSELAGGSVGSECCHAGDVSRGGEAGRDCARLDGGSAGPAQPDREPDLSPAQPWQTSPPWRQRGSTLLHRAGWNVEEDGLFAAPPIHVVVGEEVHVSLLKALSMLGLGRSRVTRVAADAQGRMQPEALPVLDDRTVVCIQAGNVNTGAFDPAWRNLRPRAGQAGFLGARGWCLRLLGSRLPAIRAFVGGRWMLPIPGRSIATSG